MAASFLRFMVAGLACFSLAAIGHKGMALTIPLCYLLTPDILAEDQKEDKRNNVQGC